MAFTQGTRTQSRWWPCSDEITNDEYEITNGVLCYAPTCSLQGGFASLAPRVYSLGRAQHLADLVRLEQPAEISIRHLGLGKVEVLLLLGRRLP